MGTMFEIFHRLFQQRSGSDKRSDPRQRVRIPVQALVGVELKQGHLEDISPRGARIRLQGMKKAPAWVDLECTHGIQRGLVRWSRLGEGGQWEGGIELESAGALAAGCV